MSVRLTLAIFLFGALCSSNFSISQVRTFSTIESTNNFISNYESNKFKIILTDFDNLKSQNQLKLFTNDQLVVIRYIKFSSEISVNRTENFDFENFKDLLTLVSLISNNEKRRNYVVSIQNTIQDYHEFYPQWSLKLSKSVLNSIDLNVISKDNDIEYSLLYIQLNCYNRLGKFKEADEIKKKLEPLMKDKSSELRAILEEAYYYITISQFQKAHNHLMIADSLLLKSPDGLLAGDSMDFYIVWAKFFRSLGDPSKAKLYFNTALEIAIDNNFSEQIDLVKYELAILEEDTNMKIKLLKSQISKNKNLELSLKLSIINSLGVSYSILNMYDKSIECYLEVYNLEIESFEKVNITTILNLADAYRNSEKFSEANNYYTLAFHQLNENIKSNFFFLSNTERESYWKKLNWLYEDIIQLSFLSNNTWNASTELSFDANLILKSLLSETTKEINKKISESPDKQIRSQYVEMMSLRRLYSKLQSEGTNDKATLTQYKLKADSIDKILVNKLGDYSVAKRKFEITWKDIQNNLKEMDAAIEFTSYFDEIDSTQKYLALLIRPGYSQPKMIKLAKEPDIKEAIQFKDFSTLYKMVWQGIDSLLDGVNRVYFSPEGELNNISFSSLHRIDNGSDSITYLIDCFELHQLTTTRYIADGTLSTQNDINPYALIYGGIDFNQTPTIEAPFKIIDSNEGYLLQRDLDKAIQLNRSNNFSTKLPYLKGTLLEVDTISKLLSQSNWTTSIFTGQNASENKMKQDLIQNPPGLLHIATHGFAFPEINIKQTEVIQIDDITTYKSSEDPMVRSGLMLSGSNISWSGEPNKMIEKTGDDGILTATEVANIDLSNTTLVVLSACETGLGNVEQHEGIYGLKRAFKLAGVEQLIVSLWSVPDKETMELMTIFYTDLSITKDPIISFNKAQRQMRTRYPFEPDKWAGFIFVR